MTTLWRSGILSLVLLVSVGALAGCAPATTAAEPTPSSSESGSATPTPTPTPAVPAAPAQVFDGECTNVLTDDQASTALGAGMAVVPAAVPASPTSAAVATAGGLSCDWTENDAASGASLRTVLLPDALREDATDAEPYCYAASDLSGPDPTAMRPACSFTLTGSGFWLSGVAYPPAGSTEDDVRAAITSLDDAFTVNAAAAGPVMAPVPADGTWAGRVDCAELAASAPVAAALPGWTAAGSDGKSERPEGYLSAQSATGVTACLWIAPADYAGPITPFSTQALPGGAWAQGGLAPGAPLAVAGVQQAVLVGSGAENVLDLFDGPNWLEINSSSIDQPMDESYAPVAAALVQALNSGLGG